MRKKTKQSLDAASITGAWEEFFASKKVLDVDQLRREGWLDIDEVANSLGISRRTTVRFMKKAGAECKKLRVKWGESARDVNFFRLK